MRVVNVPIAQLGMWEQRLGRRFPIIGGVALRDAGRVGLRYLRGLAGVLGIRWRGRFIDGLAYEQIGLTLIFRNAVAYAIYVEGGRPPGAKQPPVSAILPWVIEKLGVSGPRARSVAFLVARSIGRKGIRPRRVITSAASERALSLVVSRKLNEWMTEALDGDL